MPDPVTKPALPADPKAKTFVIAKRRTLTHGTPGGDGVTPKTRHYTEGEKIDLPIEEGEALQALGFLVNDDGSVTVPVGGPETVRGVEIKEQA